MASISSLPPALQKPIDVLMIDNFDSFTYNLYQSLSLLGADVTVIRNDAIPTSALPLLDIKHLIISPGPGHPRTDSGISRDAIKFFTGKIPVLGVCMGLECLVDVFGGQISYAGEIMHGKVSPIRHDGRGMFKGLPQNFLSTRYHSLAASASNLPHTLQVTAFSPGPPAVIMGVRHRTYTLESVQYHPESCLSEQGDPLLLNFLALKGGKWADNPDSLVLDPTLPPLDLSANPKLPSILDKIYTQRLKDVQAAKAAPGSTPEELRALLPFAPPLTSFLAALKRSPAISVLAEIKRASPSKGRLTTSAPSTSALALSYALASSHVRVISVLTELHHFSGTLTDLRLARAAVDALPDRPAILRKDFILDEYQVLEARVWGADSVLLIVAMLTESRLKALYEYALTLGMHPLVEVNNEKEMRAALQLGAKVIGVNNRNLHDFKVDMETTTRLASIVREWNGKQRTGEEVVLCALSGISSRQEVERYQNESVDAVLVGEALMKAADPGATIKELVGAPLFAKTEDAVTPPLVKICGVRSVEEARAAAEAGADMLGLMFVPSSKRRVSLDSAREISAAVRSARAAPSQVTAPSTQGRLPWFTQHARSTAAQPRPLLVGVFQNQPLEFVLGSVSAAQLDLVQLHGSEPAEFAKFIPVPVIRVAHVGSGAGEDTEMKKPGLHQFVLLDSMRSDGLSGGSGKVVDWEYAREVVESGEIEVPPTAVPADKEALADGETTPQGAATTNGTAPVGAPPPSVKPPHFPMPIILAGGLTPENVREAVEKVRPWAVDVSGGVEREDGTGKDLEKVRAFIKAAKGLA
ncbi:glutamine amidotransferase [Gloeophyllum trabeum ATCC 11539]|uniref:Multifunctional tryptophan biosynthesis protein n=1 Tax=Gloeophyllum trabeum (strain ATCC 11539 / FP-39264 / Madison 617) TaxID=670483 RepID=S7Q4R4_GLOTA|nr:glutamine amidotransferase [Gloeophyllum trabeum ATCC 11539]EPQ54996.1 glutamine amidotransferase [Gloeophyllum trabeum ATCC 11539]